MPEPNPFRKLFTRRALLKSLQYVPVAWLPAPIRAFGIAAANSARVFPLADFRITPHYPAHSPLDEIIQLVPPGTDRFISERYASAAGQMTFSNKTLLSRDSAVSAMRRYEPLLCRR
ncbi:MAG: hypothetical protein DMG97_23465 [Acidobacteria bacterium]|nr:MAG: hypothetical protein DMG97_23465 [Acidobacteriota bacterium]